MPMRKSKQKTKRLGTGRMFGRGNKKKGRGSGTKGGTGMAGTGKHKFTMVNTIVGGYFGKHGFIRHGPTKIVKVSNLYDIENKALKGKLEKKGTKLYYEFKGKILGTGSITSAVAVKAYSWSKHAEEKIKAAGGEISKME